MRHGKSAIVNGEYVYIVNLDNSLSENESLEDSSSDALFQANNFQNTRSVRVNFLRILGKKARSPRLENFIILNNDFQVGLWYAEHVLEAPWDILEDLLIQEAIPNFCMAYALTFKCSSEGWPQADHILRKSRNYSSYRILCNSEQPAVL